MTGAFRSNTGIWIQTIAAGADLAMPDQVDRGCDLRARGSSGYVRREPEKTVLYQLVCVRPRTSGHSTRMLTHQNREDLMNPMAPAWARTAPAPIDPPTDGHSTDSRPPTGCPG